MPPKSRAQQNRKLAQRRRKSSTINMQLAVDPSVKYTSTAVGAAATAATSPSFHAPVPGSMSAPDPDTQMAQGYVDLYTILPPSSSHSASSVLTSLALTDEAYQESVHAQTEPHGQPTAVPAQTAMALHSTHENASNQATKDQNNPVIWNTPVQESNQSTTEATPLHVAIFSVVTTLRRRIADFKDGSCPANSSERHRYGTLVSACFNLDPFYLILHQQYCCWKTDRRTAYATLAPVPPELVDIAFNELYDVFGDDKQMTDPHWLWCSKYPIFGNGNVQVVGLDRTYIQIKEFIAMFATNWPDMKKSLLSQMMPPMAYQLRHILKCVSHSLANALFRRIRRAIGVPDGELSARMNHLFNMDNHQEVTFVEQSIPLEEISRIRGTMMASYMSIIREARAQARRPAVPAVNMNPSLRVPALPPTNHTNIRRDTNTNRLDEPLQHQLLPQPSQGPPQYQAHAAMSRQPHVAPRQSSHQYSQHLENSQSVPLRVIHPPTQPAASSQTQRQPHPPPQQSGLRYPTGVTPSHYQQTSHPLTAPRPPGQPVLEHPTLLPPIIPPQDAMESTPPAVVPQQQASHNHNHRPHPPHPHHPHPDPHPYHHNPVHNHGHSQSLNARPMQHPLQTTQGPLPPPWARGPQVQAQGNGSHQHQTLPANGSSPFFHPSQHHMPPAQIPHTLQTPSAPQILQASWTPQPRQVSRVPQAVMTPQPRQFHHALAQVMQTPGMHYLQPQMHPQTQHSPSEMSPASTRSQLHPHFTTHALNPNQYPHSPHGWTSLQSGLHLTRLRSPQRVSTSPDRSPGAERTRYYQFFSKFILEPREIRPHMGVTTLEFDITQEDLDSLAITTAPSSPTANEPIDQIPVSRHFNNSHRYRVRLCVSRRQEGQPTFDPATWSRTPTHWPPHFFVSFNDEIIHVRRKQHFHNDLPIELTDSLVEGKNTIRVNLPCFPQNLKKDITYFMAVELITTLNHDSVWDLVTSEPHTSIEATKNEISRRLQRLETDEIVIESDTLTVTVADTFSSKLVDIPVRGRRCLHLECIDLQNWLVSRPSKWSQEDGEPSMVDTWGCPICGMDARPCSLVVDDFFAEIRDNIMESGRKNIKKIEMHADGTWTPIDEAGEDDGSPDRDGVSQNFSGHGVPHEMEIDATDMINR